MNDKQHTIFSMNELRDKYILLQQNASTTCLDIGDWLPSLRTSVRPITPGELVFVMARTAAGKSMFLQNLAVLTPEISLFFQLELPGTLLFERFASLVTETPCKDIEKMAARGEYLPLGALDHIWTCEDTRLTTSDMEAIIESAAERTIYRPAIIFVDYIGLMSGQGGSRYEKMSDVAEGLKALAKRTNTVVVAATQVARVNTDNDYADVTLYSAKDSGAIECSADLLLGLTRKENNMLKVQVLKNRKGRGGDFLYCNINGEKMAITELAMEYWPE